MTSPITGKPKALNQNGPNKTYLRSCFHHPRRIILNLFTQMLTGFAYLCVCRRATELILPFLMVGLAFAAGLAAFVPVVP